MRAYLRSRLHDLASPQGHGSLVKEKTAESLELLKDGIDVMFCAAGTNPGIKRYHEGTGSFLEISHPSPGKQTWESIRTSSDGRDLKDVCLQVLTPPPLSVDSDCRSA